MRFLSLVFTGVCGCALEAVEQLQVLGEYEQTGLRANSREASTVETLKTAVAFRVPKTSFHGLATQRKASLHVFAFHLRSLSL